MRAQPLKPEWLNLSADPYFNGRLTTPQILEDESRSLGFDQKSLLISFDISFEDCCDVFVHVDVGNNKLPLFMGLFWSLFWRLF